MRTKTILATTLAAGGLLAATAPANSAAYTFTAIDVLPVLTRTTS
jgi:hypothetical protein